MSDATEITEASVLSVGPRRRGRPNGYRQAPEPGLTLSVWVYSSHYDQLTRMAKKHEMSVGKLVRHILAKAVPIE